MSISVELPWRPARGFEASSAAAPSLLCPPYAVGAAARSRVGRARAGKAPRMGRALSARACSAAARRSRLRGLTRCVHLPKRTCRTRGSDFPGHVHRPTSSVHAGRGTDVRTRAEPRAGLSLSSRPAEPLCAPRRCHGTPTSLEGRWASATCTGGGAARAAVRVHAPVPGGLRGRPPPPAGAPPAPVRPPVQRCVAEPRTLARRLSCQGCGAARGKGSEACVALEKFCLSAPWRLRGTLTLHLWRRFWPRLRGWRS